MIKFPSVEAEYYSVNSSLADRNIVWKVLRVLINDVQNRIRLNLCAQTTAVRSFQAFLLESF